MKKFLSFISFLSSLSCIAFPVDASLSASEPLQPAVVLGGGVGGLTSALYLARAGWKPLVIEGELPGGLLTQSHSVQNWPGEMEIAGSVLMDKVRAQVEASGGRFLQGEVVGVDFSSYPLHVTIRPADSSADSQDLLAKTCIVAMGTRPNFLGVPGEGEYWGRGVTNCAICDGSLYRGGVVGVVGGGDAAVLESLYLANIAKEVHLFVRKDRIKANEAARTKALLGKPNIILHYNTEVAAIEGNGELVTHVALKTADSTVKKLALDGLFLAIGSKPNTEVFKKALRLDEQGYISLTKDQATSVSGVFAVGDIVDPVYKQAISAAGDGSKAAMQAQKFLMDQDDRLAPPHNAGVRALSENVSSRILEITSLEQFEKELKEAHSMVVVDFYAGWCRPCKQISPRIEASAHQLHGKVKFFRINVDEVVNLSNSYRIRSMPTILVFDEAGEVVARKIGTEQIADLLERLESGLFCTDSDQK